MEARLKDVAQLIGAVLEGDPDAVVGNLAGIEKAGPGDLAFVANPKYARFIPTTGATAIICCAHGHRSGQKPFEGRQSLSCLCQGHAVRVSAEKAAGHG